MLIGIMGFGIVSGLLAAMMAWQIMPSVWLAILAYVVFGSLGAVLYASAVALRGHRSEDMAED